MDRSAGAAKFLGEHAPFKRCGPWGSIPGVPPALLLLASTAVAVGRQAAKLAGLLLWHKKLLAFCAALTPCMRCAACPLPKSPTADEFLVWREIGFNACLHRHHQLHSLAALPQ